MKKIFSLIFVVLMLMSVAVPAFAAENINEVETVDSILVNTAREDLKLVYGNKLDTEFPSAPNDDGVYLITIREYNPGADDQNIFFYFYNPSEKEIKDSDHNKVLMADMWDSEYNPTRYVKRGLKLISVSEDNKFIKCCISPEWNIGKFYITYNGGRHYFVSGVEMGSYSEKLGNNVVDYHVGYTFTFVGSGANTTCIKSETIALDIKVHQTSYLTGDSAKEISVYDYGAYSNQINSVYFSLPKQYEEQFGKLSSISYEYYHYRTKPILIVDNIDMYNSYYQNIGKKIDFYLYSGFSGGGSDGTVLYYYDGKYIGCTKENVTGNLFGNHIYYYDYCDVYPYYTSVFQVKDKSKKNEILISSEILQEYFKNYNASNFTGKTVGSKKYSGDLFDLENSLGYSGVITHTSEDVFSMESFKDSENNNFVNWWKNLFLGKWGYVFDLDEYDNSIKKAKYIEEVTEKKLSGNEEETSNSLFVSKDDVSDLKKFYYSSESNNETVYLLRYALTDNYYYSERTENSFEDSTTPSIAQFDVYLDFDIIQFTFENEEGITVIPIVSTPTDAFVDVENTTPDHNVGPIHDVFSFITDLASGIGDGLGFLWDILSTMTSVFGFILKYGGWIIGFVLVIWLISLVYKPVGKLKEKIKENEKENEEKKYKKEKKLYGKKYADAQKAKREEKKAKREKKKAEKLKRKSARKAKYEKLKEKFKEKRKQRKREKYEAQNAKYRVAYNKQLYKNLKKQSKFGKRYKGNRYSSKRYKSNKRY